MLSVQPLKSATSASKYYLGAVEYYQSDSNSTCWLGGGREYLGLEGEIDSKDLENLLKGHLPDGQVLKNFKGEHRPGFDMTFSAPKSVSLLVGLGVAPALVCFHDNAVKFAISTIEKEFAETRLSVNDKITYQKTNNLLVASFRQPSSRNGDPALHTHCVTMNMTFWDGKAKSLASDKSRQHGVVEQIQNNAHYCGLLYRQHLANSLKEAGFSLDIKKPGLFEIDGISDNVLQEFSSRRKEIEAFMDEKGWVSAEGASKAAILTRQGKEEHNFEKLQERWQKRAGDIGFDAHNFMQNPMSLNTPKSWASNIKEKFMAYIAGLSKAPQESELAAACVNVAIETLSQRTSVFSDRELRFECLKHSLISDKPISFASLISSITKSVEDQKLYRAKCTDTNQSYYTTPWLLTMEAESIARIEQNKGVIQPICELELVAAFQETRAKDLSYPMTASQKEAMNCILTTKDRFIAVQGYAGVAKTTMLSEARLLIEEQGFSTRGITVASSASHELQTKAGIESDVFPIVHQELKAAKSNSLSKMLYIVDEASMLSSSQGHELIKHIERVGARLVLVGDRAQLPSISCGRIFGLTQDYDLKTSVMDEIVRQKNKDLLKAVIHATKGEVREALDKIEVKELSSHEQRVDWIANHWLSLSEEVRDQTLLFAPTHANREAITQRIREGLIKEGALKNSPITQNRLQSKQLEAIQLRFTANYQKDDVLRFNQDFRQHRVKQGEYYKIDGITKTHRRDNVLPLMDKDGNTLLFPLKSLPQYKTHTSAFERIIEVYKESPIELRVGDKIQWTRNFKSENVRNGDCAILGEIREKDLVFKDKNGLETVLSKDGSPLKHIDYGFVLTNYKVQGKDAPYGIGLMESYRRFAVTQENFYVQISRAVHGMILVTDNKEELTHALESRNHEKLASLDVLSSENLKTHQETYKKYTSISIQPVIEKQRQRENINNDLDIEVNKNIYPNKTKELER